MGKMQDAIDEALEALTAGEGVLGSAVVSRDGIPVATRFAPELDDRPFSILVEGAMVATLFGAAEVAAEEIGAGDAETVLVDTDTVRMVLVGATDDLLLVVVADHDLPEHDAANRAREAAQAIRAALEVVT